MGTKNDPRDGVVREKWGDRTRYGYKEHFPGGGSITSYRGIDRDVEDTRSSEKSKEGSSSKDNKK